MQALRIHEHGGPEVLRLEQVPDPEPAAGEVLVRMLGVSLNHLDMWVRRGMPGVTIPFPRILGCDGAGEIAALGKGVSGLKVGQRVIVEPGYSSGESRHDREGNDHLSSDYGIRGEHSDGLDCELVAVPARYALPLPAGLDPIHAAAAPLTFLTAWAMVVTRARVQAGENVLVIGGASGVGSAAIQMCREIGARVFTTASSDRKRALALELGAEVVLDPAQTGWEKEIRRLTDGRGADVVVEHVGPATWDASMRVLARNGRLVTCGGTTGAKVALNLPHLFIKNLSVLGSTMGPRGALPEILGRLAEGRWKVAVDRVLPLSRAREAHAALEAREVAGKIVLVPGS
jgi:NADPH:quinone reductase-like Zn-dependent oxidoreductase